MQRAKRSTRHTMSGHPHIYKRAVTDRRYATGQRTPWAVGCHLGFFTLVSVFFADKRRGGVGEGDRERWRGVGIVDCPGWSKLQRVNVPMSVAEISSDNPSGCRKGREASLLPPGQSLTLTLHSQAFGSVATSLDSTVKRPQISRTRDERIISFDYLFCVKKKSDTKGTKEIRMFVQTCIPDTYA